MTPPPSRNRVVTRRRVSVDLGSSGRLANSMIEVAACAGIAKRRGVLPAFQSDWVYREWFSIPDDWFVDELTGTIPAATLAHQLPPAMRPYLQSLALFSNVVPEIRAAFQPSQKACELLDVAWAELAECPGPFHTVHVRRGDTITRNKPDTIQPLPAQYFVDAVANWRRPDNPGTVFVFTDDRDWCVQSLPADWVVCHGTPGPEDFEPDYKYRPRFDWIDMQLMRMIGAVDREHGSVTISNSSFGWMAAWLANTNRVAYPSRWFGSAMLRRGFDISVLLPLAWTEIKTT